MVSRHVLVLFFLTVLLLTKFGHASEIGDSNLDPRLVQERSLAITEKVIEKSREEIKKEKEISRKVASELKLNDKELQGLLDEFDIEKD